jgi:hypothetical protein
MHLHGRFCRDYMTPQQQSPTPLDMDTEDLFTLMDIMLEGSNAPMDTNAGLTTDDLIAELDAIQAERGAGSAGSAAGSASASGSIMGGDMYNSIAATLDSELAAAAGSSHGGLLAAMPSCSSSSDPISMQEADGEAEAAGGTAGSNPAKHDSDDAADNGIVATSNSNVATSENAAAGSNDNGFLHPRTSQPASPAVQDSIIDWAEHLFRF